MIDELAERAVEQAIERLMAAADMLPADIGVERIDDGVLLTGRGLALRAIGDGRIAGFPLMARRPA